MTSPVANADFYYVSEEQYLNGAAGSYGILGNDTDSDGQYPLHAADAYGTTLNGGQYHVYSDGSFQYLGAPGFTGTDTFNYTAIDTNDEQGTGTVTVYVEPSPEIDSVSSYLVPNGAPKEIPFRVVTGEDTSPIDLSLYIGSGALSLGDHEGVTVTGGDGSGGSPMSLEGLPDDINDALQHLTFTGTDAANVYLEIYLEDDFGGGAYRVVQLRDQQPTDVIEGTSNVDSGHAQNLDGGFNLFDDTDVDGDTGPGANPHVTVLGEGNDAVDWYSFTVASDGSVIIDIDYGGQLYPRSGFDGVDYQPPTSFDAIIDLYQVVNGVPVRITTLPDSPGRDGSDGDDNGTVDTRDPYVAVDLLAGVYYVAVGERAENGDLVAIPEGRTYQLNITSPHADNIAPVGVDDSATISELRTSVTVLRVVTGSVLANDSDSNTADILTVSAVAGSAAKVGHAVTGEFGELVVGSDGSYSYSVLNTDKLITGETGHDTFQYTVSDGHGGTDVATISFTVVGDDLDVFADGTFVAHRGDDRIKGGDHADTFAGRDGNDTLLGHGKADTLFGEDGNDRLVGGSGDDRAIGGAGADTLILGSGDDTGWGDGGKDTISGGDGQDLLIGGSGDDTLDGGSAADRLQGRTGDDQIFAGSGDDKAWGGAGHDTLRGNGGDDQLAGGDDADTVFGGSGNDQIWGDAGDDQLAGGAGRDQLVGGTGNDRLFLDEGDDKAWGGGGDDQFVFTSGFGSDHIKDFHDGDKIVFAGSFGSFDEMKSHMSNTGQDVVIHAGGGNTITVEHVAALHQGDFLFA